MTGTDNELDALLQDAQEYITDAKDLTGELDLDALMRELNGVPDPEPAPTEEASPAPVVQEDRTLDEQAEEPAEEEETEEPEQQPGSDAYIPEDDSSEDDSSEENGTVKEISIDVPADEEVRGKRPLFGRNKKQKQEKTSKNEQKDEDELPGYLTFIHDICYLLVAVCLIFTFAVRIVGVKGSSMLPTLTEGDRVMLLSNFICGDYEYGNVVVAISETYDVGTPLIKRVIATEGQTVDIDFTTGTVTVDGEVLEEDYINDITTYNPSQSQTYPLTVPEGCVFVMGDNRNRSTDSRDNRVGFVETKEIIGKVFFRILPFKEAGKVQ